MTSFDYNYQNPWVCCFLVQIKAIVLKSSAGLTNLNNKAKPKWIQVVVVKYRHRVIVLLVDKRSSDGHFRIELNSSVCALLAIFALQTEDRGGRVNVCFHISTQRSIWCLNRLQLNRMATNIYFFKCQSRNNMLFCALYCVLVLRCRQRTTEIKELF